VTVQEDELEQLTYVIRSEQSAETVEGRTAAVAQAKELSARTWRAIGVESEDGRVKMLFQRGVLQTYRLDTDEKR
jgi:hypothetical protein